jgi:hypothetical protein
LALAENIRLGCIERPGTNTLAYLAPLQAIQKGKVS